MKKTLAIISTLVMVFGAVAFTASAEEATPTVTIVTNKGSAVEKGTTTYFTVKFENFASIKGIDVNITADEAITLGSVTSYGFKGDATTAEGVNYTESNDGGVHTIRFVDLTAGGDARITFAATVNVDTASDPKINVTGKYADSGKTFLTVDAPAEGTFELKKEIKEEDKLKSENTEKDAKIDIAPEAGKFIPQGSVYYKDGNNYVFATKDENGDFIADKGAGTYTYQSYTIPANGITTFGASKDLNNESALRFGSYSKLATDGATHGTMIFEGAWLELKNHYIKKGYTVQEILPAVYANVLSTLEKPENEGKTFVKYTVNGKVVNVYIFGQKNYMWKDETKGILEYTLRLNGTESGKIYTAAAFSKTQAGVVTFTNDVKSVKK